MSLHIDRFQRAEFMARTESVEIAALAEFFDPGEAPVFVVRNLSAIELHKALEAGSRQKQIDGVIKAISSQKDQIEQIRRALGLSADTPGEIAKRIEMLVAGCVSPLIDHATAAKLAEVCPVEFYDLTNRITALTGQGASRVKPLPSSLPTSPS